MDYFRHIFVVLVYKNTDVLQGFFESLKGTLNDYKVILVNSYYDDASEISCREYAAKYNCDYLAIPNKGYSAGNNVGIQFALDHYNFDFIIISNSDIIIKKLDNLDKFVGKECIIGPETIMLTGKRQNPAQGHNKFLNVLYLMFSRKGYRYNSKILITCCHACSRMSKWLTYAYAFLFKKKTVRVFSVHGSFIIMTTPVVLKLNPVFCDEMFLYNEELYLGLRAKQYNIPLYYTKENVVNHLEGASCSGDFWKQYSLFKDSFNILNKKIKEGFFDEKNVTKRE